MTTPTAKPSPELCPSCQHYSRGSHVCRHPESHGPLPYGVFPASCDGHAAHAPDAGKAAALNHDDGSAAMAELHASMRKLEASLPPAPPPADGGEAAVEAMVAMLMDGPDGDPRVAVRRLLTAIRAGDVPHLAWHRIDPETTRRSWVEAHEAQIKELSAQLAAAREECEEVLARAVGMRRQLDDARAQLAAARAEADDALSRPDAAADYYRRMQAETYQRQLKAEAERDALKAELSAERERHGDTATELGVICETLGLDIQQHAQAKPKIQALQAEAKAATERAEELAGLLREALGYVAMAAERAGAESSAWHLMVSITAALAATATPKQEK